MRDDRHQMAGMSDRLPELPPGTFLKADGVDDADFYALARLVTHIDEAATRTLTASAGPPYLLALAIVAASARKHRDFLLGSPDNGPANLLTLIANVLAITRACSQTERHTHAFCQ